MHPRLRVGVLSTGDELVEAGQPLAPGQIRDSNRATLLALVAQQGWQAVDLGLIRDDEAAIDGGHPARAPPPATPCSRAAACRWATSTS